MVRSLVGLFCLVAVLFNVIFSLNSWSLNVYGFPWGQSDYFRYEEFRGISWPPHTLTVLLVDLVGWGLFSPLLFGVVLPCCLFLFFWSFLGDSWRGFLCTLWFVFGTFNLVGFWIMGLLAQSVGLCFFLLALACVRPGYSFRLFWFIGLVFLSLACLSHIVYFGILIFLGFVVLIYFDFVLLSLACLAAALFPAYFFGWLGYFTLFSNYPLPEPSLYKLLFVFSFPLFYVFGWFGVRGRWDRCLLVCLFFTMPLLQIGRGMIFFHLFLVPLSFLGYEKLIGLSDRRVFLFFFLLMLVWFGNYLMFQCQNMALEHFINGFDVKPLYESFRVAPFTNLNITVSK